MTTDPILEGAVVATLTAAAFYFVAWGIALLRGDFA